MHQDKSHLINMTALPRHLRHKKIIHSAYPFRVFKNCLEQKLPRDKSHIPEHINCSEFFRLSEPTVHLYQDSLVDTMIKLKTPMSVLNFFLPKTCEEVYPNFTKKFLTSNIRSL
jgi:hypothetical protein